MVEGIEGGDAAGAGRPAGERVVGRWVWCWVLGAGVGGSWAEARPLVVLDFWRRKQRRNQYNVQS